jgi:hypothetical protein
MKHARTALRRVFASAAPAALATLLGLAPGARAQTADNAQLARRLEQSVRMIEALTTRLEQLERQLAATNAPALAATPAPVLSTNTTAQRLEEVEKTVSQITASSSRDLRDSGLAVHGFADVGWVQTRKASPGQRDGFAVGSLDLYLTPEFGGNVKTLVELNFSVKGDGETAADVERVQIGYTFSDALTVWAGRFHTPFGYWNMAFHHGAQIQTSILRPRMLDFEDDSGILPVHTTGIWGTGSQRLGPGKLVYDLYLGNGSRIANGRLDPNTAGDDNGNKEVGFGLNYRFGGGLDGLAFGVNGLRQTVAAYDTADALASRTRLAMFGGHVVYDNDGWELIGELERLRNTDLSGASGQHGSWTGYVHLGHTFAERWAPYYRFEQASLDPGDNYFLALANGRSYTRHVLGVHYNAATRAAVKLEFSRTHDQAVGRPVDALRLQYAVGF